MGQQSVSGGGGPIVTMVLGLTIIAAAGVLLFSGRVEQQVISIEVTGEAGDTVVEMSSETSEAVVTDVATVAEEAVAVVDGAVDAAAGEAAVAAERVLMPIDLPNAAFAATPDNVVEEINIDKERLGNKRLPFAAPPDAVLLSLDRDVTSSDNYPIFGSLDMVTDGDKEPLDGSYVEMAPDKQHVTVDLGESRLIYAVLVWHNHTDPRVFRDVVVMLSDDEDFQNTRIVYNNDHDNSSGFGVGENYEYFESDEGELVANTSTEGDRLVMTEPLGHARYVRLWANGSTKDDVNQYAEVEVWGRASE